MSKSKQLTSGFATVNGSKLYYEMLGEGHPLVLIHGGYMDYRMWDDQFATFAQYFQVIRYDVRGFGKSELPQVPYADRQDLYDLLTFLGIQKTYLLGLSLGGMIAVDFTLEYPDMVDALILVGAPVPGYPMQQFYNEEQLRQERENQIPLINAIKAKNVPAIVDALMDNPTLVPSARYPQARQRVRQNLSEYSFVYLLNPAPKEEMEPPAYKRLREIHVPTLLVMGGEDHFTIQKFADMFEQDIADTRRVTIPDTSHMPTMEKPAEFNRFVLDFLSIQ